MLKGNIVITGMNDSARMTGDQHSLAGIEVAEIRLSPVKAVLDFFRIEEGKQIFVQ